MKGFIKLLPVLCILLYVYMIWPGSKSHKGNDSIPKAIIEKASLIKAEKRPERNRALNIPSNVKSVSKEFVRPKNERHRNPAAVKYSETQFTALEEGPGETPAITEEQIASSVQLQSVVAATEDPKSYPERLTPLVSGKSFDKKKYLADESYRQKYLSSAEPARAYQSDPGSEHKLERISAYYQDVNQGEEVEISVKSLPNLPVSITSFDLGVIKESGLTFATVEADASGIATFTFKGEKGTFADTALLVSSPVSQGKLKFVVHTNLNKKGEDIK